MGRQGGHVLAAAGVIVVWAIVEVAEIPMLNGVLTVGFDR